MSKTPPHPVWSPDPTELEVHRRGLRWKRRKLLARLALRLPTAPLRTLPDFLVIGAAKSATTTLYAYLEQSPNVAWSLRKEAFFFNQTFHWGLNWYRAFFPLRSAIRRQARAAGGPVLTGEGSPDYLLHPHAPQRIKAILPAAKLVVILRNPIDRAYSFYKHQIMRTNEPLSFGDAIAAEDGRLAGQLERMQSDERYASFNRQHYSYKARGCYMDQIDNWLKHFPREQLLVLLTDDLHQDPAGTVRTMTDFLGLPPIAVEVPKRTHEGVKIDAMAPEVRDELVEYFRPHNARLGEFLGRALDWDR